MDILSVKNFKGKTTIKFVDKAQKDAEGDEVISTLQSEEPPAPAFFEAIADVSRVFMKNGQMKPTDVCKFILCNFKYQEGTPRTADCTCLITEQQPQGLKYQILFDPILSIDLSSKATPDEKKFQDLIKEAKAFIKGERAEKKLL